MKDKPYQERTGGSYLRDPKTGERTQVVGPPARPAPEARAAPQVGGGDAAAPERHGGGTPPLQAPVKKGK